jgi:RNA polymerase sigma-70 factor (ECF subfamily)
LNESLARACNGDTIAFAALVRAHERSVFSLAARMLWDTHEAEDLAQEVFLQMHRNLAAIKSDAHLGFWLRQVTARKAIDRLRQRPKHETDLSEAEDIASDTPAADHLLQRQLRKLVGKLPESARIVVLLRFQEDLDPTEIAETLDMSINTVKSHLKRSLATLRELVAKEPEAGLTKSETAI